MIPEIIVARNTENKRPREVIVVCDDPEQRLVAIEDRFSVLASQPLLNEVLPVAEHRWSRQITHFWAKWSEYVLFRARPELVESLPLQIRGGLTVKIGSAAAIARERDPRRLKVFVPLTKLPEFTSATLRWVTA